MAVFLFFGRVDAMGPNVHREAMHSPLDGKVFELPEAVCLRLLKHEIAPLEQAT